MSAVKLPKKLHNRLEELGQRVRSIAVCRAISRAAFVVPVVALCAILLDGYLQLPAWVRMGMFAGWCLLLVREALNLYWTKTAVINPEAIAHAIESEYPRMGERLTTAVELSRHTDESNGSPELIREVLRDAQTRAERLDFDRVFPKSPAVRSMWTGLAVGLLILLPLAFSPSARHYAKRFFSPWYEPPVVVDYRVVVTSRNVAVKRGDAVTLSGYVEATKSGAELPATATLVVITNDREERITMTNDEANTYRVKRPSIQGDFTYRIEAGLATSDEYQVSMTEPIKLTQAKITILPPAYAKSNVQLPPNVVEGLGELSALAYSSLNYELTLSPVPKGVWIEFTPEGEAEQKTKQLLSVNEQGLAQFTWTAKKSGLFQLVAEGDRNVKSEFPAQPLKVVDDEAPKFPLVTGLHEKSREILPKEPINIRSTATDDIAISQLKLEYRVNNGAIQSKELNLQQLNTPQTEGRLTWSLDQIAKAGDVVEMRLVATDNRRIPERDLGPQTTTFPAKDWAEFKLNETAPRLAEQEITQRKAEIETKLKDLRRELESEARRASNLRSELSKKKTLTNDDQNLLNKLRKELDETSTKIGETAEDVSKTRELANIAEGLKKLDDNEVRTGQQAVSQAKETPMQTERAKNLANADEALNNAIKKLDELIAENDRLAKKRMDQLKLDDLAKEQRELAQKAENANPNEAAELKRQQDDLQAKLKKLQEQSDAIQQAIDAAKADEANKLAKEAERLAKEIENLNKAIEKTNQQAAGEKLDQLKKKQDELTKKMKELANQTDNASRAAQTAPLKPDEAAKKALEQGDLDEATKQQEKAAQELDRLSRELANAAAKTRNPREAAKQLANLQEALRQRLAQEAQGKPLDQLPPEERDAIMKQQETIEQATAKLKTPENDIGSQVAKQRATGDAQKAKEALKQNSAEAANRRMEEAKKSLDELAQKLPSDEQRLAKAKEDINKLKQQQEQLREDVEKAKKDLADKPDELKKKLTEAAKKEAELADKLKKTDTNGQDQRQEKAAAAMEKAASELTREKPEEAKKAQAEAKEELNRLEQALNGKNDPMPAENQPAPKPGDVADQADQLAKKQRQLAEEAKKDQEQLQREPNKEQAKKLQEKLQKRQEELAQQLGQLGGTEGPKERQQAEQAMNEAKGELDRENVEGAIKKQQEAADALDRLSRENRQEEKRQQAERNADLPNQQQAEAAKQLAQEQRQLRDEAMKANDELRKQNKRPDNPAGELAKEQEQIAKQAQELGKKAAERQGEQSEQAQQANNAAQAANETAMKIQNGELGDAQKSGEQTKESLEKMAAQNKGTENSKQASDLAKQQDDLNKKLGELAKDASAAKAQQQAREKQLAAEAKQLGEKMEKQAQEGQQPNPMAKQAGQDAKQAGEQLQNAQEADANQQQMKGKAAREEAAKKLQQAAKQSREGNKSPMKPMPGEGNPQAGESVQKADEQMNQAGKELGQGKPNQASRQMENAAKSLEKAANKLGEGKPENREANGQPNGDPQNPGGNVGNPGGKLDLRNFPPDIAQHTGKAWGQLPGEIKTKIIQQMSTRYGEDYARNIKLYFEQLADQK